MSFPSALVIGPDDDAVLGLVHEPRDLAAQLGHSHLPLRIVEALVRGPPIDQVAAVVDGRCRGARARPHAGDFIPRHRQLTIARRDVDVLHLGHRGRRFFSRITNAVDPVVRNRCDLHAGAVAMDRTNRDEVLIVDRQVIFISRQDEGPCLATAGNRYQRLRGQGVRETVPSSFGPPDVEADRRVGAFAAVVPLDLNHVPALWRQPHVRGLGGPRLRVARLRRGVHLFRRLTVDATHLGEDLEHVLHAVFQGLGIGHGRGRVDRSHPRGHAVALSGCSPLEHVRGRACDALPRHRHHPVLALGLDTLRGIRLGRLRFCFHHRGSAGCPIGEPSAPSRESEPVDRRRRQARDGVGLSDKTIPPLLLPAGRASQIVVSSWELDAHSIS